MKFYELQKIKGYKCSSSKQKRKKIQIITK
jgi:hypothetical protein